MNKTVLLVLLDKYADWEMAYISTWLFALGKGKFDVKTVSLSTSPIKSMGGLTVIPDFDVQSASMNYAGLILIGGQSWRTEEAKQVEILVQHAIENNRIIGGICDASVFLGTIGVLNNVSHTSNLLEDLKGWAGEAYTGESRYVPQPAVRDGNIITANATAALEFAKEVMFALEVAPENDINEVYNFYKLGGYEAHFPVCLM